MATCIFRHQFVEDFDWQSPVQRDARAGPPVQAPNRPGRTSRPHTPAKAPQPHSRRWSPTAQPGPAPPNNPVPRHAAHHHDTGTGNRLRGPTEQEVPGPNPAERATLTGGLHRRWRGFFVPAADRAARPPL